MAERQQSLEAVFHDYFLLERKNYRGVLPLLSQGSRHGKILDILCAHYENDPVGV